MLDIRISSVSRSEQTTVKMLAILISFFVANCKFRDDQFFLLSGILMRNIKVDAVAREEIEMSPVTIECCVSYCHCLPVYGASCCMNM